MTQLPVFERDALIDELLHWDFSDIGDKLQRHFLMQMRESRLNVFSGVEENIDEDNTVELVLYSILLEEMDDRGLVQPHVRPKIARFRELCVRIAVHDMPEPERTMDYQKRLDDFIHRQT